MEKGTWTVAEWFFDKINSQARNYGIMIAGTYEDGMMDHTKLRIDEVMAETEKAYKVAVDAETMGGTYKAWTCWIPKSIIK